MDASQKEILLRNRPAILADLDVEYVEDYLLSKGVLSVDDIDRLHNKFSTRKERALHLLDILPTRGPTAFDEFVESLREPYNWLAEKLEKDIVKKPVSVVNEITHVNHFDTHKFEDNLNLVPNEISDTLTAVSNILSSLGNSICSLGDCLVDLANVFNSLNAVQKPQSVIQSNYVNGSLRGRKTGNVMRCTGGGDMGAHVLEKVNQTVEHEPNEQDISFKKLSITERRQVELKSEGLKDEVECVHTNDKDLTSEESKTTRYQPVTHNRISSSDLDLTIKSTFQTNEIVNVSSKGSVSDLLSPSLERGLPVNTPDSGMFPSSELSCHSLKSLCEVNDVDEADGRIIPSLNGRSDGNNVIYEKPYCDSNILPGKDFISSCRELRYKEQDLQRSLKDYINAVRSVAAQITERGSGIARVG